MSVSAAAIRVQSAPPSAWRQWLASHPSALVLASLAVFVAAWTVFHAVAFASLGLHTDLTEVYAWSRHPSAGYPKHPPLAGLIASVWFAVFPVSDWAFHLLAMTNAALALFAVDLIARRYLAPEQRIVILLLLMLTPFYQFHGQRFSTNQVLLSTWPLATYAFLRGFESRRAGWAIAAGAASALAMLGKYYSVYLVGSFILAALTHPDRWRYLRSASPWLSAAAGFAVLLPHLRWLAAGELTPFGYAGRLHASQWEIARSIGEYLAGSLGYVSAILVAFCIVVRPRRAEWRSILWPRDPSRRILSVLLAGQILLPPLTAPLLGVTLTSLWSMSAWFLLPVVLLANAPRPWPVNASRVLAFVVGAVTLGAIMASPVVGWTNHRKEHADYRAYAPQLSRELSRAWREQTGTPLRLVVGPLGYAAGFYAADHPDGVLDFDLRFSPWVTPVRLKREGWAAACAVDDASCNEAVSNSPHRARELMRTEAEVSASYFSLGPKSRRFYLWLSRPDV